MKKLRGIWVCKSLRYNSGTWYMKKQIIRWISFKLRTSVWWQTMSLTKKIFGNDTSDKVLLFKI